MNGFVGIIAGPWVLIADNIQHRNVLLQSSESLAILRSTCLEHLKINGVLHLNQIIIYTLSVYQV
jgi:hypothetical protein